MQVLIIAASQREIDPFIESHPFTDTLITGVGVPATIYHLQKRLQQISYDFVIQAGIAGSFSPALAPGKTVLVRQDRFGDLGMEEKEQFKTIYEEGFDGADDFPFTGGWLWNPNPLLENAGLLTVNAVTVNKITDNPLQKKQLLEKFTPQSESMEGAALHYVCLQENIPFLQLRSISNYVGDRDRSNWKLKEALINLNLELGKLVAGLLQGTMNQNAD